MVFMFLLSIKTVTQFLYMVFTKYPEFMHNGQDVSACLHVSGPSLLISQ
jgi:hypothetical protein